MAQEDSFPRPSPAPADAALYMWGYNGRGQTSHKAGVGGDPRTWRCQRTPFPLRPEALSLKKRGAGGGGAPVLPADVACGLEHTLAASSDGMLFAWGRNDYGQLGDGSEDDSRKPKHVTHLRGEHVKAVACGARCSAAITRARSPEFVGAGEAREGRLWVWGENQNSNHPRLFRGAFPPKTEVVQVSCGAAHAAAISSTGLLQTWGYNEVGQLGWGVTSEGLQPARLVPHFMRHLDEAPVLSADLALAQVLRRRARAQEAHEPTDIEPPPPSVRIVAVACGDYHTAAVDSSGELYTWGLGLQGQLGHRALQSGHGTRELLPRRVVALEGVSVRGVACGRSHTCAVTNKGALYVWGGGKEGQLGTQLNSGTGESPASLLTQAAGGGDLAERLQEGGRAAAAALEELAAASMVLRLPVLLMSSGIADVACGTDHTLAVNDLGELLGWGYNSCGQAVSGRAVYAWQPTRIDWCVGRVRRIAAGGGHTAVLMEAQTLRDMCEFRLARMALSFEEGIPQSGQLCQPGHGAGKSIDSRACGLRECSHLGLLSAVMEAAERLHALSLLRFCALHRERLISGADWDLEHYVKESRVRA